MDLTFQVPMQYWSLQHRTLVVSPVTSTTGCCVCFGSVPSFVLEFSPVISSSILGTYRPGEFIIQFLSFCLFILFMGFSGQEYWSVCHSLLQWITYCQTSPPWPICLGWPHMAWLSFIELDKAVVCVIRLASFWWLWFQFICPLTPSLSAYRLTWVSLTLDMGYLFSVYFGSIVSITLWTFLRKAL